MFITSGDKKYARNKRPQYVTEDPLQTKKSKTYNLNKEYNEYESGMYDALEERKAHKAIERADEDKQIIKYFPWLAAALV